MRKSDERLLAAVRAALKNESVYWEEEISREEWKELFDLAEKHHILPLVFEAVYRCSPARACADLMNVYKRGMKRQVIMQTIRTGEFLDLYRKMLAEGVRPLVVKGIICRELYPKPDSRSSSDEDMLIPEECFLQCHALMSKYGMQCMDAESDLDTSYEISYGKQGSPLYIELHRNLFAPDSDAYGELNSYFADVFERAVSRKIQGVTVYTLGYGDHLFYLICHALKHFLHSGFGIRQVCDIVLYAQYYGKEIDWEQLLCRCRAVRGELFAAALFQIGEKYFDFSLEKAGIPDSWRRISVNEAALLEDLLSGGVYGKADADRVHSSTITLNAVAADRQGRRGRANILKTLFPPLNYMKGQSPWLKKYPFLLPAAWIGRMIKYGKELRTGKSTGGSIRIADQRLEILREYKIIK